MTAEGVARSYSSDMVSQSRGAMRPKFCTNVVPRETREQGIPGARCTRGLVCKSEQEKRTRAYRFSGGNPAFPAQWFYGLYRALPGDRACLTPSPREYGFVRPVGLAKPPRDLTPTAEASGPHDFAVRCSAVRLRAQEIAHGSIKPALRSRLRAGTAASTASRPNVRDDGQRPSRGTGWLLI